MQNNLNKNARLNEEKKVKIPNKNKIKIGKPKK
jgi:hypothetical protein